MTRTLIGTLLATAVAAVAAVSLGAASHAAASHAEGAPDDTPADEAPADDGAAAPRERWLVGDLHVHVSPPDAAGHSMLTVARAIDLARRAHLDFVALTPHRADAVVETDDGRRERGQDLVRRLANDQLGIAPDESSAGGERVVPRPIVVISAWEWTRESPGHLGVLFAPVADVSGHPRGAERAIAAGGVVIVNHPFFGPVTSDDPLLRSIRTDRRWKPFAGPGGLAGAWNAIEVWHDRSVWVERLYGQREGAPPETRMLSRSLAVWDAATKATRRRITAVGGSDAHGRLPYTVAPLPVVSVRIDTSCTPHAADDADDAPYPASGAASGVSSDADDVRDALRRGLRAAHVTFGRGGGAAARDFSATSDVPGERAGIGDALRVRETIRLTWDGRARLIENGEDVGEFEGGAERRLARTGAFAFWRIEKPGDAYSNMIYANLAEAPATAR